jgi:hypothetical protein
MLLSLKEVEVPLTEMAILALVVENPACTALRIFKEGLTVFQ